MANFIALVHEIRLRLRLRARPTGGAYNAPQTP